ncbi:FecCD family ABC transporter permease [Alkalibacter mobilis]|uniref:FecCD family ABC transporter permease n=1 Tax=Alkalibacter mobilis TaxID=2787712 RepID=UPI0018A03F8C|nr:iron ABC transporter permease [Alkalibacter mobilis]MBF7097314.1 iron ABC transporter permease [Alkalibacter mobilis]
MSRTIAKKWLVRSIILLLPISAMFLTLFVGRYHIGFFDVLSIIAPWNSGDQYSSDQLWTIIFQLRLPRAIAGAMIGASLAVSGAAYQGVFRNPLVNSGILGVSSGASFGASLAIVVFGGGYLNYLLSFVFGVAAVLLAYLAGRIYGSAPTITLVLGGVVVSSFFSAFTSMLKYVADPYSELPALTFWTMGSLSSIGYKHFWAFIPIIAGVGIIYLSRWKINILSMGDKEAATLGLDAKWYKVLIIGGATLSTSSAVCISGTIGWIGLIVPHICRMIVGNDNTKLIPWSMSLGATFLILIDTLSRSISTSEIPIGILTAILGTPFFVYLLKKTKGGGWK